jgi:hypothetical protein
VGRLTRAGIVVVVLGAGCRERAQVVQSETAVRELVHRLETQAEQVTGLRFKRPVAVRLRTREQVRAYIVHKFDQDLPPRELAGAEAAYRLFGLIPDSMNLRQTILDLLTEQVAGYYDPDSTALFIPTDQGDPTKVRQVASQSWCTRFRINTCRSIRSSISTGRTTGGRRPRRYSRARRPSIRSRS